MNEHERYNAALAYADRMHAGQTRKGGEPYITHPVAVAEIVADWGYGTDYRIAALFHDLLEDTVASAGDILRLGNDEILRAVRLLTKEPGYRMSEYVAGIKANPMARVVKAADRLHNLRCALDTNIGFRMRYIRETMDWYMDLCPEIDAAVRQLARSLPEPMEEYPSLYE